MAPVGVVTTSPVLGTHGKPRMTTAAGHPIADDNNSLTIGELGYVSMEDFQLFDKQAHFNRERIPERVVHAKGVGAHGFFEVTKPTSDICKAKFLSEVGKKTPVFARFSTVGGESGSADTVRDPRGFSVKFYTEDGNWDFVGNNTPVFFIRDPSKFPDLNHTHKRDPRTHQKSPDAFWDFLSLVPESIHQVLVLFSPRGIPDGMRHMNGYGSHTYKWVDPQEKAHWVKFHFKTNQGIKNLSSEKAAELAGSTPDYSMKDMFDAIEKGDFPSWTLHVQVMSLEDAEKQKVDPFDVTKVWSHKEYPLREVGKFTLNKNVDNYFCETEQVAFSPSHMPPGIEPSPDRVLQSRLFSYDDAARYRVGSNYLGLPINLCPFAAQTYQRDGAMRFDSNGGINPNYYPNSISDAPKPDPAAGCAHSYTIKNAVVSRAYPEKWKTSDDYVQPRALWAIMPDEDKAATVKNIAGHLGGAKEAIQKRQIGVFNLVSPDLGKRVEQMIAQKK